MRARIIPSVLTLPLGVIVALLPCPFEKLVQASCLVAQIAVSPVLMSPGNLSLDCLVTHNLMGIRSSAEDACSRSVDFQY